MEPVRAALPISTRNGLAARVRVPGSKSITNRALLVAALAEGKSQLLGALDSDDTVVMRDALRALGVEDRDKRTLLAGKSREPADA